MDDKVYRFCGICGKPIDLWDNVPTIKHHLYYKIHLCRDCVKIISDRREVEIAYTPSFCSGFEREMTVGKLKEPSETDNLKDQEIQTDKELIRRDVEIRLQGYKEGRASKLDSYNQDVLKRFCSCCNQEACEGGMVGTIQECTTVGQLRDVLKDVKNKYEE